MVACSKNQSRKGMDFRMSDTLIKVEGLCKIYNPGENAVYALKEIQLDICKGEFIAIVGSSGSGKSTLMNILGCLDVPTSGSYLLEGIDVSCIDDNELSVIRNKKIGFIFQGFNLVQSLNALENVELPLAYRGIKHTKRHVLGLDALSRVSLADRASHLPSEMSGGQQQRVAIARAIAARPPLILADEPTGNLDTKAGNDVMDILFDLNREGKTIILITHDMAIAKLANRIIKVSDGMLV